MAIDFGQITRTSDRARLLALGLALAVVGVTACSSSSDAVTVESDSAGMTGMETNMGDPDAVPAYDIADADIREGELVVLDTRPPGYDGVTGRAFMARHAAGTTVTIEISGLQPGEEFIAHVHEGACAEAGGAHFKFEAGGSDMPPNEIHLLFTSASDGTGFMTAENEGVAGEDARSVVVHPLDLIDNKIACAEL
ncbi:MAG: superoxide dismutase family protein [Acidimicrobiia bacterium]